MSRMAMRWSREDGDDVGVNPLTELQSEFIPVSDGEVEEISGDITDGMETLAEGEAAIGEAEQIQDTLEESIDSGEGISEVDANILQIQTESISRRLGLVGYKSISISSESISRSNDPVVRARIALEGIGSALGSAWDTIKRWFSKLWKSLKNFYKSIFDANYKLIKRAKALKERKFSSKDGEDNEDIEDGSLLAAFSIKGNFSPDNVIKIVKAHAGIVGSVRGLTEKSADLVRKSKSETAATAKTILDMFGTMTDAGDIKSLIAKYDGESNENVIKGVASTDLVDGMKMGLYLTNETDYGKGGDTTEKVSAVKFFHSTDPDADDKDEDGTVEVATIEQCRKICTSVIELGEAMEALAKNHKRIDSLESAMNSEFDKWKNMKEGDRQKEAVKYGAAVQLSGKERNDKEAKYKKDKGDAEAAKTAKKESFNSSDFDKDWEKEHGKKDHGSPKIVKSIGTCIMSANNASLKYGYKAGNKALNYVAKCQSKFKSI